MAHDHCFGSDSAAILVQRIGVVGFISEVGGITVGFFILVYWELSPVCLFEVFSKTSFSSRFWRWHGVLLQASVFVFLCLHVKVEQSVFPQI